MSTDEEPAQTPEMLAAEVRRLSIQLAQRTGELRGVLLVVASLSPDELTPAYRKKILDLYDKTI